MRSELQGVDRGVDNLEKNENEIWIYNRRYVQLDLPQSKSVIIDLRGRSMTPLFQEIASQFLMESHNEYLWCI